MGSVLDSERKRQTTAQLIASIQESIGDQPVVLSAIGYTELLLGLRRESDPLRLQRREVFFEGLIQFAPVEPYTVEIAELAGRLGGEQAKLGINIPFSDLLIGATALSLGYSVLTTNLRHFRLIPGLNVIPFKRNSRAGVVPAFRAGGPSYTSVGRSPTYEAAKDRRAGGPIYQLHPKVKCFSVSHLTFS